jgi:AraC-like DNA-binding protein/ligand-binding sensor protein
MPAYSNQSREVAKRRRMGVFRNPNMCAEEHKQVAEDGDASVFSRLLSRMTPSGRSQISFEDLTGFTLDHPVFHLPFRQRIHTCSFCMHAKSDPASHLHCVRNKMAVNRVVTRSRKGVGGTCHLGLTEVAQPLVYRGTVLGVFYLGGFVLDGSREAARARIRRFCRRHGFEAKGYLAELDAAPQLSHEAVEGMRRDAGLLAELAVAIADSIGLPVERYRTRAGAQFSAWNRAMPALVQAAVARINARFPEPVQIAALARELRCHPDHLSRSFRKTVGVGILDYLHRVRVDHARRLLESGSYSAGEVGQMVGFQDQSHFGKVFRQITGLSPGRCLARGRARLREGGAFSSLEYSNVRPFTADLVRPLPEAGNLVV